MDRVILEDIPFEADEKGLAELLRIRPGSKLASEFTVILHEACSVARPKAVFAVANAVLDGEDTVKIGGIVFKSRLLHENLKAAGVVYPFVATCGTELEEWSRTLTGSLRTFWADTVMLMALGCAVNRLESSLKESLGSGIRLSTMNPGSLPDWPLEAQPALFSALGEAVSAMGVRLTEKMVISPLKSISGLHFVSEDAFINCRLCPRRSCPSRRSAYEPGMYRKR